MTNFRESTLMGFTVAPRWGQMHMRSHKGTQKLENHPSLPILVPLCFLPSPLPSSPSPSSSPLLPLLLSSFPSPPLPIVNSCRMLSNMPYPSRMIKRGWRYLTSSLGEDATLDLCRVAMERQGHTETWQVPQLEKQEESKCSTVAGINEHFLKPDYKHLVWSAATFTGEKILHNTLFSGGLIFADGTFLLRARHVQLQSIKFTSHAIFSQLNVGINHMAKARARAKTRARFRQLQHTSG